MPFSLQKVISRNYTPFIGVLALLILIVFGMYEYYYVPVRLAFNDAPFYFYNLVLEQNFFLPHDRYMAFVTEYLPLLAIHLDWSFSTALNFFGINLVFSYLIVLSFFYYTTRNLQYTAILILSMFYGMAHSYFYYVPEHFQYFISLFLVFSLDHCAQHRPKLVPMLLLLSLVILMGSNMFVILLFFVGLFYLVVYGGDHRRAFIYSLLFLGMGLAILRLIKPVDGYESEKVSTFIENLKHIAELDKAAYVVYVYLNYSVKIYYFIPALLVSIYGIYLRKYTVVFFAIASYIFLYYFTCVYFFDWESNAYMDLYGRLTYLSLLPLIYILIRHQPIGSGFFMMLMIITISVLSLKQISKYPKEYSERYRYVKELTELKPNETKVYLREENVNLSKIWFYWATPFESMIIAKRHHRSTTVLLDKKEADEVLSWNPKTIHSSFLEIDLSTLKGTYFEGIQPTPYFIYDKYVP